MRKKNFILNLLDLEENTEEIILPEQSKIVLSDEAKGALDMAKQYFANLEVLKMLVTILSQALPPAEESFDIEDLEKEFFDAKKVYLTRDTIIPDNIGLIVLNEMFRNKERFTLTNPKKLPGYKKLTMPIKDQKLPYLNIEIGDNVIGVPAGRHLWIEDLKNKKKFIIEYGVNGMSPGVSLQVKCGWADRYELMGLVSEIKDTVASSPYIKGQILELSGHGFSILDMKGDMPIVDKSLKYELDKNIFNMFRKSEEFRRYGLPVKRAIILEGSPGCGKTMICRHVAAALKGEVTVLWVTSKAIESSSAISNAFELARKLSPSLIVMEDLDLISGTRFDDQETLGEMLNQLDGVSANENIVVIATTNKVASLDEALRDRPGRFDRIYRLGKPSAETARMIAESYLKERGINSKTIKGLNLDSVLTGDLTGAQVVEAMKGGIFEAIHIGQELNDICIQRSINSMREQRKTIQESES
jgi:hypothetical protein